MNELNKKIEKIIDDAFEMGRSHFPDDYKNLRAGMIKTAEYLINDEIVKARIDELVSLPHTTNNNEHAYINIQDVEERIAQLKDRKE